MDFGLTTCQQVITSFNSIPSVSVLNATYLTNGTYIALPDLVPSCVSNGSKSANATNDLCRIVLNITTSASSTNRIEAWLPDDWNGRFLATGNGGIGGCIDYKNLQHGAGLGFATFGTNGGHDGQTGFEFFLNQNENVNDFGYRAIHAEAVTGKQVVETYYGRNASYNYYSGCSTGGRQGYEEAILYPEDFDGILMGSMGVDWLHVVASKGILVHRLGWPDLDSPSYVTAAQWSAIVEAQIKILDPLDGVTDGIIDNPTLHNIDPSIFACGTGILNSSVCLTGAQVNTVQEIYQPLANSSGHIVYPRFDLGADTSVFSVNTRIANGTTVPELDYTVLTDYWRGAVYNSSTWTPLNFTTADMDFAVNLNSGGINIAGGSSHDVSAYHARGGKLLAYHGRADETVTSSISSRTFQRTAEALHLTLDEMHDFFRLFYIPGMGHCSGGNGAWSVGQPTVDRPAGAQFNDTQHNILLALVAWVEDGSAPQSLVGTKFEGDQLQNGIVEAQRTHCVYPNASRWNGEGDTKKAESWTCMLDGGE
ncbi:tannase and feruloyl esterase [Massarina eburnea CBS 473.64]|uniref:Carboxylic ester hydrolase n=1 Tax=Massarina eburnea CBS 473.64 TaxID=1395130 RepID=A0A6A6RZK7_9PLEO|nr:tannase and feruloyl esterase [Massarina eburnea CBS 473.64]